MPVHELVARLTNEWWKTGPLTIERLTSLFEHFATVYDLDQTAKQTAWNTLKPYAHIED